MKNRILAIIPARAGSKRIPNKNIRKFLGKPLIAYAIKQAKSNPLIDRVIVDTDSEKIARIALRYGAEVPFLRPRHLASAKSKVQDAILHLLNRLKKEESYQPEYFMILQTTSPLREQEDINHCWRMMKKTRADTILTVCPTHPRLYHLDKYNNIILANKVEKKSTNIQEWPKGYLLNGCFVYIVKTAVFLRKKSVITKNTKAVICPRWRSVDLDTSEDWAMAELIYKNKKTIKPHIKKL